MVWRGQRYGMEPTGMASEGIGPVSAWNEIKRNRHVSWTGMALEWHGGGHDMASHSMEVRGMACGVAGEDIAWRGIEWHVAWNHMWHDMGMHGMTSHGVEGASHGMACGMA